MGRIAGGPAKPRAARASAGATALARVLTCGRHEAEMIDALADMPGEVRGVVTDLGTLEGVRRLFERADEALDAVDALVNNAALPIGGTLQNSPEDIEYVIRSNPLNYVQCTRQALGRMTPRGAGHVVFVGSLSADVRAEGESTYAATKGGVQAFAEALRKEVNRLGIRVSLIQPGSTGTDM